MTRIQEKVKDLVEVRPYNSIRDFLADPAATLSNYHFTDVTSDLMAKWLDGIASVQAGNGTAFALAGYRGVGKSHFLATLGALAANPELRTKVSESHVAFSAQRLQRRHYPVAYLRRGTHETVLDELKAAVSSIVDLNVLSNEASYTEILTAACEKSGDVPFILMIDTAFERGLRVTRDDGTALSEIAEAAKELNVFVGVALDDDIAGADGSNSSIVRSFSIDFLDQAHLYKVVNTHIFPKNSQTQPVLHDIYKYFREVLPSFRWSEQKFASLYPLHPAILEVAPYVRLYVHEFAILGFASEAGEKILGRPANSLIALDEIFDNAENGLRKIEDLGEAFAAYDTLNSTVVGKIPVMQRLQAKLILKALLLLSLDGQGGTANDICASVMIFDESDPEKGAKTVEELLNRLAEALPDDLTVVSEEGLETRYGFKLSSKESLNNALAEALKDVSTDTVPGIILRMFQERFADSGLSAAPEELEKGWIDSQIVWRGGLRRGRIFGISNDDANLSDQLAKEPDAADWEVFIDLQDGKNVPPEGANDLSRVFWKPDPLRPDEIDKLRSYYALSTNGELREIFSEQIRASVHAHSTAVEKIVERSFLEDGKLVIDGFEYGFTEAARSSRTLSELFSAMLEPLFETRYPAHPYFPKILDFTDVAAIVTDLYNGTRRDLTDVQSRAQTFALPLGLVRLDGGFLVPETGDKLIFLPIVNEIIELVLSNGEKPVLLTDVYSQLRRSPNGLVREAQQMVLTALVAQRLIEFVTSSGNRINRRSLDLQIIWGDIVGIAKPGETNFSDEKAKRWAGLFLTSGDFQSLDRPKDQAALQAALAAWTASWKESKFFERFAQLPDDVLNVRIWRLASRAAKTFGSVAESIEAASIGSIPAGDCLDAVADAFSESEAEFRAGNDDLATLSSFIDATQLREEIHSYLAVCEVTGDSNIERLRERASGLADAAYSNPGEAVNKEMGIVWEQFKNEFSVHFETHHENVMKSPKLKTQLSEILQGDQWWEFEMLSDLSIFDPKFLINVNEYRREINKLDCNFDMKGALNHQPFCACAFSLNKSTNSDRLPKLLSETISQGLRAFRATLLNNGEELVKSLVKLAEGADDLNLSAAANEITIAIQGGREVPPFSDLQLKVLRKTLGGRDAAGNYSDTESKFFRTSFENEIDEASRSFENFAKELADDAVVINT